MSPAGRCRLNNPAAGTYNTPMGLTRSLRELRGTGAPAIRALAPRCIWGCAATAAMLWSAPGRCVDDFPPPISNQSDQPASAAVAATAGKPAEAAEATKAGDATADAQAATAGRPAEATEAAKAGGATADAQPVEPKPERDVRIEQKHIGRRVSEVIVTPAGFTYHYTMIHLDDQDPGTTLLQPHPELSVPRFLRFDF
ncbi:MAG TPA: hypothetical protein VNW98_09715 [Burkholderiaceae bacterium]|jgi:hypothetical protein|nr:hypothetical protein [Burkholderiaceae bacterium]